MPIIATAGWSFPKQAAGNFSEEGSVLQRYASRFNGVEVNSTFYRRHRPSTFARWAQSVPEAFRFALKIPKAITHERRLVDIRDLFELFVEETSPLGDRRGPLLCQLPPSLAFHLEEVDVACDVMRDVFSGPIFVEARHRSWDSELALTLLHRHSIGRVLADPAPVWPASSFGEHPRYVRLHGKPKIYYSSYTGHEIVAYAKLLAPDSWCVFDNTAAGAATENALEMQQLI